MRPLFLLPLLAFAGFGLSGCVAGIAASAVGAAVRAAAPGPVTEDRRPPARAACEAQAAAHGQVRIIDAEQRSDGRVTVWGTVEDDGQRRAFRCRYERAVTGFRLREIGRP